MGKSIKSSISLRVQVKVDLADSVAVSRVRHFLGFADVRAARSKPRGALAFLSSKDYKQTWDEFNAANARVNEPLPSEGERVIGPVLPQSPVCVHRLIKHTCSMCRDKPTVAGYHGWMTYADYKAREATRIDDALKLEEHRQELLARTAQEKSMPLTRLHGLNVEEDDSSGQLDSSNYA